MFASYTSQWHDVSGERSRFSIVRSSADISSVLSYSVVSSLATILITSFHRIFDIRAFNQSYDNNNKNVCDRMRREASFHRNGTQHKASIMMTMCENGSCRRSEKYKQMIVWRRPLTENFRDDSFLSGRATSCLAYSELTVLGRRALRWSDSDRDSCTSSGANRYLSATGIPTTTHPPRHPWR